MINSGLLSDVLCTDLKEFLVEVHQYFDKGLSNHSTQML